MQIRLHAASVDNLVIFRLNDGKTSKTGFLMTSANRGVERKTNKRRKTDRDR